jgi:hypothetical protein
MNGMLRHGQMKSFFLCLFIFGVLLASRLEAGAETKPSLAILPFFIERVEDPERGNVCPICKGVYRRGKILPGSQNTLTRLLYQKVEAMGKFTVLPIERVEEALSQGEKRRFEESPISSSIRFGRDLKVDFIFVGFLFRFEERIGSSIGVEKPASVGCDLHLFRLRDGKMVWLGKFDETQRPLSENLFKIGSFVRRKAQWLTAEELASVGMDEMLRRLPDPKELEERQ